MTDLTELRQEFSELRSQAQSQSHLLRELSSLLNSVSSTLTSASQISAHERESLISRLESIDSEITQERRQLTDAVSRIERALATLERDLSDFARDRGAADTQIAEIHRDIEQFNHMTQRLSQDITECLRHARKLVGRDPDTGTDGSKADAIIKFVVETFWRGVATAVILMLISKLYPFFPTAAQH